MDQYIIVSEKKLHVYSHGQGNTKIVLLSGSGVPFPQLEYMAFANALSDTYEVLGIEKFGYGHSDLTEDNRNIDVVVDEYRCALKELGIHTPVILAAHSMGFLEALRWGQKYPEEILGILGIDPAVPECYRDFDIEKALEGLMEMSENESLRNQTAEMLMDSLIKEQQISAQERDELTALAKRNLANDCWISEARNLRRSLALVQEHGPYLQIPMLFFLSNGQGTTLEKEVWITHALNYLKDIRLAQFELFDYPHNLYKSAYEKMAALSKQFISDYIE